MSTSQKPNNHLLAALSAKTYKGLSPQFESVELKFGETVYGPGDVLSHIYFVESGIVSMLAVIDAHSTLEVGMVGVEGMVGLPFFLGKKTSGNRAVVQGSGHALRIKVADFDVECVRSDELPYIMRAFTYSILVQIARSAVCNRFHDIESRLARWLMMTQDRMRSPDFRITQDFLSYMLGVRREAVNKSASSLQQRKLISYVRGNMSVIDRKGLEALACNCYGFLASSEM